MQTLKNSKRVLHTKDGRSWVVFFQSNFLKIKMSRVPNTKLSDQWEKEVEHVSKLIISKFVHIRGHNKKKTL